ncbi:MAG: cyclic nucleotide-binding domain-containing protein [Pseudomonadota bacterium]|nr:cyclic nucleotide-binding domain-containing protein [Pseudomonadota bacterium]
MTAKAYKIAVIGAGPAGLSAAARAAELGVSHVLLEAAPHLSNTIYRYQKGKLVMAEPTVLPLRSSIGFEAGSRELVLSVWDEAKERLRVNVRHGAEVAVVGGTPGNFSVSLAAGEVVSAEFVVLATGLQGNLRKLGVPGENLPFVQYQLDDPDEYENETIVVVGAGDSAIENAVALAAHNKVIIINRRDDFDRAKEGNRNGIERAIQDGAIECLYNSAPVRAEAASDRNGKPGVLFVKTADGEVAVGCDRVIARLGAMPPRKFVESCGIEFPNDDPNAVPAVSAQYESNVRGLYIIGALAGYPLIKQAMNQGYEVVEFIEGRAIEPADEPVLRDKFRAVVEIRSVASALEVIKKNVPVLSGLTTLQLREFLLDSVIRAPKRGEVLFELNDYSDTFFSIVRGGVDIHVDPNDASKRVALTKGDFFGEMGLISGRRRNATVTAGERCILIETPRRSMNKLINSVASVKRIIDDTFLRRAIQSQIAPELPAEALREVVASARIERFDAGKVLFKEGDPGDSLHLIRKGSVTVARDIGGRERVLSYVAAGNYVGEMALLTDSPRSATVRASIETETIRLDGTAFKALLSRWPDIEGKMQSKARDLLAGQSAKVQQSPEGAGDLISFLVNQGVGEATDVLLIDETLCVRCDHCEKACAETHGGTSRLDREAGPTFAFIHVPTSCRHCEHPHCMKDCPPDALRRAPNGEVIILDSCIGCGNCETNCPYGVIQMAVKEEPKPVNLLSWFLFGKGRAPGEEISGHHDAGAAKIATKCDMCKDLAGGPACVRACPTGAAIRVSPEQFLTVTRGTTLDRS